MCMRCSVLKATKAVLCCAVLCYALGLVIDALCVFAF